MQNLAPLNYNYEGDCKTSLPQCASMCGTSRCWSGFLMYTEKLITTSVTGIQVDFLGIPQFSRGALATFSVFRRHLSCLNASPHLSRPEENELTIVWNLGIEVCRQQRHPSTQSSPKDDFHDNLFNSQWQSSSFKLSKLEFYKKDQLRALEEKHAHL